MSLAIRSRALYDFSVSYLSDCLDKKVIFFTGKGGVGKSSLAWATARLAQNHGKKVATVSWSPFDKETQAPPSPNIDWVRIETLAAFREYALQIIKFDKLFDMVFDNHVFKTFIKAAPGLAETVAAGKLWDLYEKEIYDLLVVDLPSSGHAVSFFQSPKGINKLFRTGFIHKDSEHILEMFEAPTTRIDLVTLPEELPVVECRQLKQELEQVLPFHLGYLHFNQCTPELELPPATAWEHVSEPISACLKRHQENLESDKENYQQASTLGLPVIRMERLAVDKTTSLIDEMAARMEGR
ncbi:MAG: ArsA family ATPase [Bdellovibrionales bacterium]|nr:ArsA family ATPase [Bdellovibrionales bacterium]